MSLSLSVTFPEVLSTFVDLTETAEPSAKSSFNEYNGFYRGCVLAITYFDISF